MSPRGSEVQAEGQVPRGQTQELWKVRSKRMLGPCCCGEALGSRCSSRQSAHQDRFELPRTDYLAKRTENADVTKNT